VVAVAEGGLFFERLRIGAFERRTRSNHAMPRLSRLFIRLCAERWPRFRPAVALDKKRGFTTDFTGFTDKDFPSVFIREIRG